MGIEVTVVRVFVDDAGKFGNRLGIISADAVPESDRQKLATELGFSETIFFSADGSTRARATIYTPAAELPFAGHPTVGLAWWLRHRGTPVDTLSVPAADVHVRYDTGLTWIRAQADWAPEFVVHQESTPASVGAVDPASFTERNHYVWAWTDREAGAIRSRMFAPTMGIAEDEATGSAAIRITEVLGRGLTICQGAGSNLVTTRGIDWIELGGRTVLDKMISH